ncbi:sensor histidine kinase [Tepidibacter hydrothermalis]|uniref:histidine kinase n=1 Tax=Tepidibacter hydrothermalis TaxID=3036126 RepID=A0ABY8EDU8_9FIRM|nr:ATP-binding protein [Tepidibacter hydrothermalis]WFD11087.1 ATP-binding protein [Tepidibacter hydrothermalis]
MKLFLREYLGFICIYFFNFIFLLIFYNNIGGFESITNIFYFIFITTFIMTGYLIYKYYKNKKMYCILNNPPDQIEEYLCDIGNDSNAQQLENLFKKQYSLYQGEIQNYVKKQKQHLVFMNHWVHQMKTPISVIQLIIQENEDEPYIINIRDEIDRIQNNLNTALYLARIDNFEHDFKVETVDLKVLVFDVVNNLKRVFIKKHIYPEVKIKSSFFVQTDFKWMKFVIHQVIINAIKYSSENKKVSIEIYEKYDSSIVKIKDEGVGIPKTDIKRVFEPSYTGENGRVFGESTGMGLYIVSEVCKRLGHKIEIESEVNKGTIFKIIFKKFR